MYRETFISIYCVLQSTVLLHCEIRIGPSRFSNATSIEKVSLLLHLTIRGITRSCSFPRVEWRHAIRHLSTFTRKHIRHVRACFWRACCIVEAIKTFLYVCRGCARALARAMLECMPTISIPIHRRFVCKVMRLETSARRGEPFLRINIEISVEALKRKRSSAVLWKSAFTWIFNFPEKTIESSV